MMAPAIQKPFDTGTNAPRICRQKNGAAVRAPKPFWKQSEVPVILLSTLTWPLLRAYCEGRKSLSIIKWLNEDLTHPFSDQFFAHFQILETVQKL